MDMALVLRWRDFALLVQISYPSASQSVCHSVSESIGQQEPTNHSFPLRTHPKYLSMNLFPYTSSVMLEQLCHVICDQ